MTDREKLIEMFVESAAMDYKDSAEYFIANGVTFQKWIPVSERLPEDDLPKDSKRKSIKVLVTYKTSSGVPVVRTQVREKDPWFNSKGWDWTKYEPITHWMPLPEAPKEVDK